MKAILKETETTAIILSFGKEPESTYHSEVLNSHLENTRKHRNYRRNYCYMGTSIAPPEGIRKDFIEETHRSIQMNHQNLKMLQSKIFVGRNEKRCRRINQKMRKLRETKVCKSENYTTNVYYRQYIEEPATYQQYKTT